jgi:ATP-dependent Zn protease
MCEARIAYHEAGHAVIGMRLRLRLKHVTIRPDLCTYGLAHFKFVRASDVEKRAITAVAGPLAEKKHLGRNGNLGNSAEYRSVISEICFPSDRQAKAWRSQLRVRAQTLVNDRWAEIEKVAAALLERETLTGAQVGKIIRQELSDKRA